MRDNAAEGESFDRIVPRTGCLTRAISHRDVLSLANNLKACLFQGTHRLQVIDARDSGHGLHLNLDFADFRALEAVFQSGKVFADGILDVVERFFLGVAFRPAAGERRHVDADAFVGAVQGDLVFHGRPPSVSISAWTRIVASVVNTAKPQVPSRTPPPAHPSPRASASPSPRC